MGCSENILWPTAQCSYALLLTDPSELRQTSLSGHRSTFSSGVSIFQQDFFAHIDISHNNTNNPMVEPNIQNN